MYIHFDLQFLNTNHSLYNAVVKAEQEGFLQTEAHRAAHALRTDFEKGGIHLSVGKHLLVFFMFFMWYMHNSDSCIGTAEKMDRVNQLNTEIVQLGRQYVSSSQLSKLLYCILCLCLSLITCFSALALYSSLNVWGLFSMMDG